MVQLSQNGGRSQQHHSVSALLSRSRQQPRPSSLPFTEVPAEDCCQRLVSDPRIASGKPHFRERLSVRQRVGDPGGWMEDSSGVGPALGTCEGSRNSREIGGCYRSAPLYSVSVTALRWMSRPWPVSRWVSSDRVDWGRTPKGRRERTAACQCPSRASLAYREPGPSAASTSRTADSGPRR